MSPEQACGDLDRLGPRSDVYSLGATLYCLLTGKPPFEGEDVGEILRKVQRGDFAPPRQLEPSLDAALEAVCLKAMANQPGDRYPSCRALADDVERWMADEPVSAWAEPWTRKLLRWLTRHRTGVTGAAAAVLAGVVGLSAVLAVQARANLALADKNTARSAANAKIEARYNLAVEAIKTFHTGVSEDFLLKEEKFRTATQGDCSAERETSTASWKPFSRSRAIRLDGRSLQRLCGTRRAHLGDRLSRPGDRTLSSSRGHGRDPGSPPDRDPDARSAGTAPGGDRRASVFDEGQESRLANYREALAIFNELTDRRPEVSAHRAESATVLQNLGVLQSETGSQAEALASYERARALRQGLVDAEPANAEYQDDLAASDNNIGNVLTDLGRDKEALAAYERCLETPGGPGQGPPWRGPPASCAGPDSQQHWFPSQVDETTRRIAGGLRAGSGDSGGCGRGKLGREQLPVHAGAGLCSHALGPS